MKEAAAMEEAAEAVAAAIIPRQEAFPMEAADTEGKKKEGIQNETAVFGAFLLQS